MKPGKNPVFCMAVFAPKTRFRTVKSARKYLLIACESGLADVQIRTGSLKSIFGDIRGSGALFLRSVAPQTPKMQKLAIFGVFGRES